MNPSDVFSLFVSGNESASADFAKRMFLELEEEIDGDA